jgi:hypothetical protein
MGFNYITTIWGRSARCLRRIHSWTANLIIFLSFLEGVDAIPHCQYVDGAASLSSLAFVTNATMAALFSLTSASMVGITEVSAQKCFQRGQSTLFTYFIPAMTILLFSFALMDEGLEAK